jgi:CheY-like chemotaxis protein
VVIADDVEDGAESLAVWLRIRGHDVVTAHDGEEAVAAAEQSRPEFVLLDLGMPKMDGLEACRRIRAQGWGRNVIVIAMTGWGQERDRERTRDAGFDFHLVKPVDPPVLLDILASTAPRTGSPAHENGHNPAG